jgi:ABC-type multidrug transport system fused ATPase/permease subunit
MQKTTRKENIHTDIPQTPLAFVFFAAKQNAPLGLLAIAFTTLGQLCSVFLPFVLKKIIDIANTTSFDQGDVLFWVTLFPVLMFTMFTMYRLSGFVGMEWLTRTETFSYNILFDHLTKHSHTYFSNRFAGSITNKIHHASEGAFRLLDGTLWGHYGAVLSIVASGVLFYLTNFWVGVTYTALICILVPINLLLVRYRRPFVVQYSSQKTLLRGSAVDVITNMSAVRQFSHRNAEFDAITKVTEKVRVADVRQWRLSEWALTFNNFIIVVAVTVMLSVMYRLWVVNLVSSGDFVLVLTLILSLTGTLVFIGSAMNQFIRVYGEVQEGLSEVLLPYEIVDHEDAKTLMLKEGKIEWDTVSFDYGDSNVFNEFNLTIKAGERVGLVGSSGAGKSTFVSLLLRQHELTDGSIRIDGQNIAEVTQDSLRENIAVVPQEPMLFHRTIRENIAYGKPDASDEEVIAVAKKAEAHDFIMSLKDGYNTLVGERGVKLSGGQKQRVAIARAMLKNAPILVLDEATSALDSESEVAIQKALHELMTGKTVIAIAHRLSTLREMDRIIVLDAGKIVEDGTHMTLTKKRNGIYARLWKHQAGGFLTE